MSPEFAYIYDTSVHKLNERVAATMVTINFSDGERLQVHPHCLMFFMDETGHEEFADPLYPVFGIGGCAVMAAAVDEVVKQPWRAMKDRHFGGAGRPLHAADLCKPTAEQIDALVAFFREQPFARFAATMTVATCLPAGRHPYEIMPPALRRRWEEIGSRCVPAPVELALIHEASQRGDELLERYFGPTVVHVNRVRVPVRHGLMAKSLGDEALEVADFIVQAAGREALHRRRGRAGFRKDFASIFQVNPLWSSFIHIESATTSEMTAT